MTLQDFITTWDGKYCEVAGSANAKYQCVDLVNEYFRSVWNEPIIEWTNAVDFPQKISSRLVFTPNTPDGIPPEGAVVVFKKYGSLYGTPGHIAINITADVNRMTLFEQNYPTGKPCQKGTHNYLGCVGWITKPNMPNTYTEEQMTAVRLERDRNWNLYKDEETKRKEAEVKAEETRKQLEDEKKNRIQDRETLGNRLMCPSDLPSILSKIETLINLEDKARDLEKKLSEERNEYYKNIKEMERKLSEANKRIESLGNEVTQLGFALEQLKKEKPEQISTPTLLTRLITWLKGLL